jgi:hypothetical protein
MDEQQPQQPDARKVLVNSLIQEGISLGAMVVVLLALKNRERLILAWRTWSTRGVRRREAWARAVEVQFEQGLPEVRRDVRKLENERWGA